MYDKKQLFGVVVISIAAGYNIGYSKARERFLEALIVASAENKEKTKEKES